ncbi:hypothetical protein ACFYYS_00525 [Streptomyces sp. NPDC002120]|uniref:hypothetical protein n=1 Tax=Streptomyces sp. NPDC002120 TaxID=3364631 RepID=UPI0036CBBEFA
MFKLRQKVFDNNRGERGEVTKVHPLGGLITLQNSNGFSWLAANENCSATEKRKPTIIERPSGEPFRIPPGTIPHENMRPSDLRVGDFAFLDGRLLRIRDMRGRFGGGRTIIFDKGRARPAEDAERIYRSLR